MTSITIDQLTHPRIRERREAVEGAQVRRRNRRFVMAGALALAALLGYAVTQSPLLDVNEVRVIGAGSTGPNALRAIADIEPGAALVDLDLAAAEQRLLALPAIEQVSSSKSWSGIVTLEVVERRPVANIATPDGMVTAAADGIVLEVATVAQDLDLPIISGAMFSSTAGALVPAELNDALAVAAALPDDVGRVTERIELSADGVALRLDGGGAVALGDARNLDAKVAALRAFLAQVDLGCLDVIDVQAPLVPVLIRHDACR